MWHVVLEVLNNMTMKIVLLRDVTIFCVVDICHCLRTTGWICVLGIRIGKLCYKVRNGGFFWKISTFQNKKRFLTTQNKESVRYNVKFYIRNSYIFLNSLLLFFSRHVNGKISLIWAPQYIMYWKRAYYKLLPISENIPLLTKYQNGEKSWTNSSVSVYKSHYFL